MLHRVRAALVACALFVPSGTVAAQGLPITPALVIPDVQYDSTVPTPAAVLGFRAGQRHARPDELVTYYRAVGAASDRVVVGTHGTSYEGRPLVHAIVTSPANHRRLEAIRTAHLRLSDAPGSVPDAALHEMPVVVYLGYSVHGNEASGSDASLVVLYHLAAGRGAAVDSLLERAVIILDASFNPDGRARFVEWVNGNRGAAAVTDPQDREHIEPWPGGRYNHYWFDPNRDWLTAQHPEARGVLALYHRWRPNLLADLHEMGSDQTYFFQPGVPSRVHPLTPERNQQLTNELATYHARALDRIGSLYFTKQNYDDFYYGKGSAYPDINGAVGILFEQGSARALRRSTAYGTLEYGFTVRNQVLGSLSSIEGAVAMRTKLLAHMRDFYRDAPLVAKGAPTAWLLSLEPDRTRALALLETLQRHRVQMHALTRSVTVDGVTYRPGTAVVIPAAQAQQRVVRAAFDRMLQFRDSIFYDISSWTLPLAYGVATAEWKEPAAGLVGEPITDLATLRPAAAPARAAYAYALEWTRYFAPRALWRLQQAGVLPVLATSPFEVLSGGQRRALPRGTIIIPVQGRDPAAPPADAVHALVQRLAAEDDVVIHAVDGGLATSGPDLGAQNAVVLRRRSIALVAGDSISVLETGAAWHLLSERFRLPVSLIAPQALGRLDLSRYTTIVLAGRLVEGRDGPGRAALAAWVRSGGTLITIGRGTRWAIETGMTDERLRPLPADTNAARAFGDVTDWKQAQELAGAILETVADTTHPLMYGLAEPRLPLFRGDTLAIEPSREPGATVLRHPDRPALALTGYVPARAGAALRGSAALIARRSGDGRIILFADDPNFRAFWYRTNRLFLNAIFLSGAI